MVSYVYVRLSKKGRGSFCNLVQFPFFTGWFRNALPRGTLDDDTFQTTRGVKCKVMSCNYSCISLNVKFIVTRIQNQNYNIYIKWRYFCVIIASMNDAGSPSAFCIAHLRSHPAGRTLPSYYSRP